MARVWDAATGKPVGPALRHRDSTALHVHAVAFSSGGMVATADERTVRLWKGPSVLGGEVERVARWVEVTVGLEMAEGDEVRRLDVSACPDRRRRLNESGGPPAP